MKYVLVTGASTGIGLETTRFLASKGFSVYAGARKKEDIDNLNSLENVVAVKLDVTSSSDIESAFNQISQTGLFGLVNNAGVAVSGPLLDLTYDDLKFQFDVNLFGLHEVTRTFYPLLKESKGRIVNVSSVAGHIAPPFLGAYSASKFALEAYSDSLRRELDPIGIKVVIIEPGDVKTPIWDKRYVDIDKIEQSDFGVRARKMERILVKRAKKKGLEPIKIAEKIYDGLTKKNPKHRYLITRNNLSHRITRNLPSGWVDSFLRKNI